MREYVNRAIISGLTAPGDLLSCALNTYGYAAAVRFNVMANTVALPAAQMVEIRLVLYSGATLGSGGTATAATPLDYGDVAAGSTCHQADTTPTSGTAKIIFSGGFYLYQGIDYILDAEVPYNSIGTPTAIALQMLSTPSGTIGLDCGLYFVERGYPGA